MSWLPSVVTTPPSAEPISSAEAKAQVHVDAADTDFDTELGIYIPAAREHVEAYTGTRLVTQTVTMRCSSFCDLARLPVAPLQSITSVKYLDADGVEQTVSATVYEAVLAGLQPEIRLKPNQIWPAVRNVSDAVRIVAQAGYGAAAEVPAPIRHALLLTIADWMRNREDTAVGTIVNPMPNGAEVLLANYRTFII